MAQSVSQSKVESFVLDYVRQFQKGAEDPTKPFVGAVPKLLTAPEVATPQQTATSTRLACATIAQAIVSSPGVLVILAQDASYSPACRGLLQNAGDTEKASSAPTAVCLNNDWLHTVPRTSKMAVPAVGERLLIFVGTPGKYLAMCMKSKLQADFDTAYHANRLVVVTKGAIMLPLGSQMQNIFGASDTAVLDAIATAVSAKGAVGWGHGVGTKGSILERAFLHLPKSAAWHVPLGGFGAPEPLAPLPADANPEPEAGFDSFADYVLFENKLKLALPALPVVNYWDTGLLVSIIQGFAVERGASLLTDRDGLAILRDASIGHIISKMHQVTHVQPYCSRRAVFNFFIGDGASRLNTGVETAFHLVESYHAQGFVTLFILNNHKWAIEDNLVNETEQEHVLYNRELYDTLASHPSVTMTNDAAELHATLAELSALQVKYATGAAPPQMRVVVVRGLDAEVPVLLGDIDPIRKSPEMAFMRGALGAFASGCEAPVPLYGCSAFEYIQYLKMFLDETPEGTHYQYVCGRTDIQAAHMCGFDQPEGRCVLFVNDVYGINSLGESLRMVQSGLGGKQLVVFIWHPSLLQAIDNFHLHRPAMVWPNVGPTLAKFYVRKQSDACFLDFDGAVEESVAAFEKAVAAKTPLVVVNMLPEHERNCVSLDIRAKLPK